MTMPDLTIFRTLTHAETKAHARYLDSIERGSRQVDAAQHAIAQMLRGDVTPEFVSWLSNGKLRVAASGRVTRHHEASAKPILTVDDVWGFKRERAS